MKQQTIRLYLGLSLLMLIIGNFGVQAQKFTSSPYSRFGLGDIASQSAARNKGMGGVGIALNDKFSLNTLNPASYTSIDSTSFLFDVGITGHITKLKSSAMEESVSQGNFEYLAFGFSVKKWWAMSVGVRKITNVGYDLSLLFEDAKSGNYLTQYTGDGGINKVYWTNAFRLNPNLSIGINANYNWGKIMTTRSLNFQGASGIPFNGEAERTISSFDFELGVQYDLKFKENKKLRLGATFGNKTDIASDYTLFLYRNTIRDTIKYETASKNIMELPNRFGIGIAFEDDKWILATDINYQAWGGTSSKTQNVGVPVEITNSYKMAAGAEYTPNKFTGRKLIERMSYRTGLYYNNSHLKINGTQIREFGLTAGVGIPVRSSYINLAVEVGTRGTTDNNLINEKFIKMTLGFTLFENWFQKILYN